MTLLAFRCEVGSELRSSLSRGGGQQAALQAVRQFAETLDKLLPLHGEGWSKREELIDAASRDSGSGRAEAVRLSPQRRTIAGNALGAGSREKGEE